MKLAKALKIQSTRSVFLNKGNVNNYNIAIQLPNRRNAFFNFNILYHEIYFQVWKVQRKLTI